MTIKMIGVEEVNYKYTTGKRNYDYSGERNLAKSIVVDDVDDFAGQLKNPIKTIRKAINIIWITE